MPGTLGDYLASLTANEDTVQVSGYRTIPTTANVGLVTTTGRHLLDNHHTERIRQSGSLTQLRLYLGTISHVTEFWVYVWRKNGTTWDIVGRENVLSKLTGSSINTVTLTAPIAVQAGDYLGFGGTTTSDADNVFAAALAVGTASMYFGSMAEPESSVIWTNQTAATFLIPCVSYMRAPVLVVVGDSIAAGHPANYSYIAPEQITDPTSDPAALIAAATGCTYQNMGIGSQTTTQIAARFSADVAYLHPRACIILAGLNDIVANATQETFIANMTAMLDQCREHGILAVVAGLPWTNGTNAQMQTYDAWIAALAPVIALYQNAIYVDLRPALGQFRAGGDTDNLWDIKAAYDADGVHYNADGYAALAAAILAAPCGAPVDYAAWSGVASITVADPSARDGYAVRVEIPYIDDATGTMLADFADLRFATDAGIPLYFYLESYTASTSADVWVRLPASTASFKCYYGNAEATSLSDGRLVFDLFDPADWTPYSTWDSLVGMVDANGVATCTASDGETFSRQTFGPGYAIRARLKTSTVSTATGAVTTGIGFWSASPLGRCVAYPSGGTLGQKFGNYAPSAWNYAAFPAGAWAADTYVTVEGKRLATEARWTINDGAATVNALQVPTGQMCAYLAYNAATVTLDWIAVRKCDAVEPTCTFGTGTPNGVVAPVAAFSADVTSGASPLSVALTDESTNTPTEWAYTITGPGGYYDLDLRQNPTLTLTAVGTYSITLQATNAAGSDTETKTAYITVTDNLYVLRVLRGVHDVPAVSDPPTFVDPAWGTTGTGDGQFNGPNCVALSPTGHLYVVDWANRRIQKFDVDGTFLCAWGAEGSGNGQFTHPNGVAVAPDGSVYVTDAGYGRVQKFTPEGVFITKWGNLGTADGEFTHMEGVAVDEAGNVYVCDCTAGRVQKFSPTGQFILKWGSVGTGDGQFGAAHSVAVKNGAVYVTDSTNHRVQQFTTTGAFVRKWGSSGTGNGQFNLPRGVAIDDDGAVYVTEQGNHRVQIFYPDGTFILKWGSYGSALGQFNDPHGVAVSSDGIIYIADNLNNRIQRFTFPLPDGEAVYGDTWTGFTMPVGICTDSSGNVYVTDISTETVSKFAPDGTPLLSFGEPGTGNGQFDDPYGIAVAPDGSIIVTDTTNRRVQVFSATGTFVRAFGSLGTGDGQFTSPMGVCTDSVGNIYVSDVNAHRVQKFTAAGVFVLKWGSYGTGDGQFSVPAGIVSHGGYVYVCEDVNNRVQKFTADGTFVLKWGTGGSGDGQFNEPYDIDIDGDGHVVVIDRYNNRVQRFTTTGTFVEAFGSYGEDAGQFDSPLGIAIDRSLHIYVADTYNHRVQKFTITGGPEPEVELTRAAFRGRYSVRVPALATLDAVYSVQVDAAVRGQHVVVVGTATRGMHDIGLSSQHRGLYDVIGPIAGAVRSLYQIVPPVTVISAGRYDIDSPVRSTARSLYDFDNPVARLVRALYGSVVPREFRGVYTGSGVTKAFRGRYAVQEPPFQAEFVVQIMNKSFVSVVDDHDLTVKLDQIPLYSCTFRDPPALYRDTYIKEGNEIRVLYNNAVLFSGIIGSIDRSGSSRSIPITAWGMAKAIEAMKIQSKQQFVTTPANEIAEALLPDAWEGTIESMPAISYTTEYGDVLTHEVNLAAITGRDWSVRQSEVTLTVDDVIEGETTTTLVVSGGTLAEAPSPDCPVGRYAFAITGAARLVGAQVVENTTNTLTVSGTPFSRLALGDRITVYLRHRMDLTARPSSGSPAFKARMNRSIRGVERSKDIEKVYSVIVVPGASSLAANQSSVFPVVTMPSHWAETAASESMLADQGTDICLSAEATSVILADASDYPDHGVVGIESERILYSGKSGNTLTGCTRGAGGTTAAAHNIFAPALFLSEYPMLNTAYLAASGAVWIGMEQVAYTAKSETGIAGLTRGVSTRAYPHGSGAAVRDAAYTTAAPEIGSPYALYGERALNVPAVGAVDQHTLDVVAQTYARFATSLSEWGSGTLSTASLPNEVRVGDWFTIGEKIDGTLTDTTYRIVGVKLNGRTCKIEFGETEEFILDRLRGIDKAMDMAGIKDDKPGVGIVAGVSCNKEVLKVQMPDGTYTYSRLK